MRIQLAAGAKTRAGWINIDGRRGSGIDLVADLRRRIPVPDSCADAIFCEHFLEHLDYYGEAPCFLKECARVLRPGGIARFVVPDGEWYLTEYVKRGPVASRDLHRGSSYDARKDHYRTGMEVVNEAFHMGGHHRFMYDFQTLASCLQEVGFEMIERKAFRESNLPEVLDSPEREWNSLYVEARRPAASTRIVGTPDR